MSQENVFTDDEAAVMASLSGVDVEKVQMIARLAVKKTSELRVPVPSPNTPIEELDALWRAIPSAFRASLVESTKP